MFKLLRTLIIGGLLSLNFFVHFVFAATEIKKDGVHRGYINVLDFAGAGVTATTSGITGTVTITSAGTAVDDTAYGVSWSTVTDVAPSKKSLYDKIETLGGGHAAVTVTDSDNIDFTLSTQDITAIVKANVRYETIVFNFKSFGQAIAASTTLSRTIPYAGTITGWEIFSSASGSMVCTINKSTTSSPNAPSWSAISGSEKPTLSTAVRNTDTSLSTWTTAVAAGNQIQCSVDATPDITGTVTVVIYITKT